MNPQDCLPVQAVMCEPVPSPPRRAASVLAVSSSVFQFFTDTDAHNYSALGFCRGAAGSLLCNEMAAARHVLCSSHFRAAISSELIFI